MNERTEFNPDEIIFAVTDACNLKCAHCFVERKGLKLDIEKAKNLMDSCLQSCPETEWKVGFSGGEPFLNLDFLCEISKFCVEKGIVFDRIMTNALWWKDENELKEKLTRLFESGYDGKIGISFDSFHGGDFRYIAKFCRAVFEIWKNSSMIEIQTTYSTQKNSLHTIKKQKKILQLLAWELGAKKFNSKNGGKNNYIEGKFDSSDFFIRVSFNRQVFASDSPFAWKDKKWFKEDFCQTTGNIFYVHTDGKIAPCCGYANENDAIIIGTIDDDYETLMKNVAENRMIKICFEEGLSNWRKTEQKNGKKFPGKTSDICLFCDYICKNKNLFKS